MKLYTRNLRFKNNEPFLMEAIYEVEEKPKTIKYNGGGISELGCLSRIGKELLDKIYKTYNYITFATLDYEKHKYSEKIIIDYVLENANEDIEIAKAKIELLETKKENVKKLKENK